MKRTRALIAMAALMLVPAGCATEGQVDVGVGFYGSYWDDPWYWSGCCVDPPDSVGPPPHPEHPIAKPDRPVATPLPSQPTATPRSTSTPSPRPAMRSGGFSGGGRGGGGRR